MFLQSIGFRKFSVSKGILAAGCAEETVTLGAATPQTAPLAVSW